MYAAITTRYLPPTNHRGARIRARWAESPSVTIPYPHEAREPHRLAAVACLDLINADRPAMAALRITGSGFLAAGLSDTCAFVVDLAEDA